MFLHILLLLVGFILLIKGADFFVDGSSSVAKLIGIPGFVIGLTVVAMGTSAPEVAVSITAGLQGSNEIAISNVIGSNIFNLLVVAGTCAVIKPYKIEKELLHRDFPVNLAVTVVLFLMALTSMTFTRLNGILMLICFVAYIAFILFVAFKNRETQTDDDVKTMKPFWSIVAILGGLAAVIFGGDMVVDNATEIAKALGWSETFIGLTIIAIGTSLPELVTSIVAARKGESGLALGNVIGSNIFNIMLILGLSSSITPIPVDTNGLINIGILIGVTAFVFVACLIKKGMGRVVGAASVLGYCGYTAYLLLTTVQA
ncbi:MAG: calcium/sodium antiporter [Lachnospiraceae bacterium]|nr:calcium/sodium antiporter [Lachnospiraceae bacterium]